MGIELEQKLPIVLFVDGKQYCLYRDSGYSRRVYLEVRLSGLNLTVLKELLI